LRVEELDFELPPERIAQEPPARREDARLLVLDRRAGTRRHLGVGDLPALLASGDLLVLNDTRVLPARLLARRQTGGRVELLLLEADAAGGWRALVKAGGSLRPGERLEVASARGPGGALRLLADEGEGAWRVEALGERVEALLERAGRMPLPPYVRREDADPRDALDRERYQTTYARAAGAVAAPTAGLHLTPALLDAARGRGVETATVTLHVGLGTFESVRAACFEDHRMHAERYAVPRSTVDALAHARAGGGRVVAVGTTTVRTLEAAALAAGGDLPREGEGRTDLMILPGFAFRVVDALLTNFHLPRSTLLALVAAFAGTDLVLETYREAVALGYRFFSYGDAMLIL
jgi:S-adenosylmethionine:tRNA ribosyltransferase-isomerase